MWRVIKREPVLFQGVIQAGLSLGVVFGLRLSGDKVSAVLAFSAAALALLTRTQVTPLVDPKANDGRRLIPQQ
jgi:hypothetical protein